jgi:tetratricopeptide (TPR) repeat protein
MIRKLLIAFALFFPAAAHAEWYEATSRNFIVYSEGNEQDARDFAAKLERFNHVLRAYHRVTAPPAPNKLRVFLMASGAGVAQMLGAPASSGVAGYYSPGARAQMLVGTRSQRATHAGDLDPESILLHEYTHHFMYRYFPATYPTWYSEGFAEFWGSTRILANDVIEVGLPAEHRFSTFRSLGWLPIERLLRAHNYQEVGGTNVFLLYAEGWLLVRYAFEHPERRRQLEQYLGLINGGTTYEEAARQAFPDIGRFNSELYDFAGSSRFTSVRLPFRTIDVGEITTRALRPAEQALITHEIKLSQGYPQREAAEFATEVRTIAARFPDDPFAIGLLMEAERLAGNDAPALAAADRLLALQPNNARALTTKGLVQIAQLRAARSADEAAWTAARQLFVRANRVAENDPLVLEAYYDSFVAQGVRPPDGAQNALYSAMELAPSDGELRFKVAADFEQRDMVREAIAVIRPDAYATPHRGNESDDERRRREEREEREREAGRARHETAREMLARLEEKAGRLPGANQPPTAAAAGAPPRN